MKKYLMIILAFGLSLAYAQAQTGSPFPAMSGKNLNGKEVQLPRKGEVSLVALAYSPKSEEYLARWRKPLFDLFVKAPGTSLFDFDPYDANVKFVVLLTGAKKVAGKKVRSKLEENVQDHWREHIAVVKGKTLANYPDLDLGKKKNEKVLPYFFLMDKSGKIVYHTSGAYTSQKRDEIEAKLSELLGDNQFQE